MAVSKAPNWLRGAGNPSAVYFFVIYLYSTTANVCLGELRAYSTMARSYCVNDMSCVNMNCVCHSVNRANSWDTTY
eukprot:6521777-Pyramimonas_sp.AAC.1